MYIVVEFMPSAIPMEPRHSFTHSHLQRYRARGRVRTKDEVAQNMAPILANQVRPTYVAI